MKLTGERPIEGKTPDSLLALHAAGYRELEERLGEGRLLDLGCGLGDGTAKLAGANRELFGIDYDSETAASARDLRSDVGLQTICSDGAALAVGSDSFDWVTSSHLIEHFVDPTGHVSEVSRVLKPSGTALFLTPNEPADFENPYHLYLFDPEDLQNMLGKYFKNVTVLGLDATEHVKADFEKRRALARKALALDPFGLRHKLPRSWFVALHAAGRRVAYKFLSDDQGDGNSGITADEFFITDEIDETTLVLMAIATDPV